MEINLKQYFMMIRKRLWIIVLCVSISSILANFYSNNNYRPIYQASTKLIVNTTYEQDLMGGEHMDYGAIGINIALINTYKEIIKTPAIMDKVVQRYPDLNFSTDELISSVNMSNVDSTQVITIGARHYSYDRAVKIANAVSEVFRTEIPKIMKVNNITILNSAKVQNDPKPVNQKSNQIVILGIAASIVVAIGIILLLDALDDTLKTNEDIRLIYGKPTLAVIPNIKEKQLKLIKKNLTRNKEKEANYATNIN